MTKCRVEIYPLLRALSWGLVRSAVDVRLLGEGAFLRQVRHGLPGLSAEIDIIYASYHMRRKDFDQAIETLKRSRQFSHAPRRPFS